MARLEIGIDLIVANPLPRALETAEILADFLGLPEPRTSDLLLPEASPERLLASLRISSESESQGLSPRIARVDEEDAEAAESKEEEEENDSVDPRRLLAWIRSGCPGDAAVA